MYVRWQLRKRNQGVHWRAILVESVRINGKPTQRHIAYLLEFPESVLALDAKRRHRCHSHHDQQRLLWYRFAKRLDNLGTRISLEERCHIEALLSKKIGSPPTVAIDPNIGPRIAELRAHCGLKQPDLARALGINRKTVGNSSAASLIRA